MASPALALEPLTPISFQGGVDYSKISSEIDDTRAADSSNMVGNREGSAETRNGSHRLNSTAVSSQPFTALFSATIATATKQFNVLLGVSGNTIYVSTDNVFQQWTVLYSSLTTPNQKFSFAVAQNSIFMTGNALTDPIFKYDVASSSFGIAITSAASTRANIYAKYLLWEGNYMIAANVRDVNDLYLNGNTTYYDDRAYYSFLLAPSSFTVNRFLPIQQGDSESLTGMTAKRSSSVGTRIVEFYKQTSIHSLSFTILNPVGEGGDQAIAKIADGFGHIADSPPENIGAVDFMLSKDGIIQWDGGLLFRANLDAEKTLISRGIKPIIDKLISRNTYRTAILKHYAKRNWLIFAYEDPDLFPKGTPNSTMIYDIVTGEWWPQKNWIVGCLETDKNFAGKGLLMYGDGKDGFAHVTDDPIDADDSRKEISIDPMEAWNWKGGTVSANAVAVGTVSIALNVTPAVPTSSMSRVFVMPLGEWYDKTQASRSDLLSFKVFPSNKGVLRALRIDLLVEDNQNNFTSNFSSVTISSGSLTGGTSQWSTVEIAFSSFPILDSWTNLQSEAFSFSRNLTRFGLRFAIDSATADETLYFDDIRFVQSTKNPLNPQRLSKRFNLGSLNNKEFYQVILGREKSRDAGFKVDVFTGLGEFANTIPISADIPKEIFVCGYNGSTGIARLSSVDFTLLGGTFTNNANVFFFENGTADPNYVYAYDVQNARNIKIDRSSFSVIVSSAGELGTGTSNYNQVQEMAVDSDPNGSVFSMDHMNARIKEETKKDFTFIREYGQLGLETTSFYNPTGIDKDGTGIYVGDDSNQRVLKFDSKFNQLAEAKLDINLMGNLTVRVDDEFLYDSYTRGSDLTTYFTDVVLEKRNKGDLSLISRVTATPMTSVEGGSFTIRGSIALHGRYIFVCFNDNSLGAGSFFLQKRLKTDFSLVAEAVNTRGQSGVIGDGLAREPSRKLEKISLGVLPSSFVQFKFYQAGELDGPFKLDNMTIVAEKQTYTK